MGIGENVGENTGNNTGSSGINQTFPGNPSVETPDGLVDGGAFTINGGPFGSQLPTRIFSEYFDGNGTSVSSGDVITTSNTNFPVISGSGEARFTNIMSRGSDLSADVNFGLDRVQMEARVSDFNQVFMTYALAVPDGYIYPNASGGAEETFPTSSSFKQAWLLRDNETRDGFSNDLVECSWTSNRHMMTGNNVFNIIVHDAGGGDEWSWDVWNRRSLWLKQSNPGTSNVDLYWSNVTSKVNTYSVSNSIPPASFYKHGWIHDWNQINFPGLYSGASNPNCKILYADITIDIGPNAGARVELGNNVTYASCSDLAICELSTWNNAAISGTIKKGGFTLPGSPGTLWWFVHDKDNQLLWSGPAN